MIEVVHFFVRVSFYKLNDPFLVPFWIKRLVDPHVYITSVQT